MGKIKRPISETIVAVRGGGDLATGVVQKLVHAGFKVIILETAKPLAIRRTVAFCNAVFQGRQQVEDLEAVLVSSVSECSVIWNNHQIPILIDSKAESLKELKPTVLVDAILAKKFRHK